MGKKRPKRPRINRPVFRVFYHILGWRWELTASNGKLYAKSARDGFKTRRGCLRSIEALRNVVGRCEVKMP